MKRHGHVVAQLDTGEIVSGLIDDDNDLYYIESDGCLGASGSNKYIILKDFRSEFYAGQECEFWNTKNRKIIDRYLVYNGIYNLDMDGCTWKNCKAIDPQADLKAQIEQKRKELAELEAKLKQEK